MFSCMNVVQNPSILRGFPQSLQSYGGAWCLSQQNVALYLKDTSRAFLEAVEKEDHISLRCQKTFIEVNE